MANKKLLLIELNEINFEIAKLYADRVSLPNFSRILASGLRRTSSECRYEQLEPWIQWVSAHTGLTAEQHGVFRLGDMVQCPAPQLFEQLEAAGVSVGAISPMNTVNRLNAPAYFMPDAWTRTSSDGSIWSRILTAAVAQAVNDNSDQRLTLGSALSLIGGLVRFASPRNYGIYLTLALRSRGAPWRKALFLDLFLHDLHRSLWRRRKPQFSVLFLNAGAHIQHHYLFNSRAVERHDLRNPDWYVSREVDPFGEMLQLYDRILGDYLQDDSSVVVATGLTQRPYDRVKFYYRLRDHEQFLTALGLRFRTVEPRMTRDFLICFDDAAAALAAEKLLASLVTSGDGVRVFNDIDNRGDSLFVTLTYPKEIKPNLQVIGGPTPIQLAKHVVFVAIKNGMHDAEGFLWCSGDFRKVAPVDGAHVKCLHDAILAFFDLRSGFAKEGARS